MIRTARLSTPSFTNASPPPVRKNAPARPSAAVGDWPNLFGPTNDSHSHESIRIDWPEIGPTELWRVPIGRGYSSPIVAGDLKTTYDRNAHHYDEQRYIAAEGRFFNEYEGNILRDWLAKSLELETPYVPPPGDALEHHASGFAKIMCSAVFITGLDPDFSAENVGYFTSPYSERAEMGRPVIDRAARAVHVTLPTGVTRTARYLGSQGCVTIPLGQDTVNFAPVQVTSRLPDPSTQPWPMGDVLPADSLPQELAAAKVTQAARAAFEPPAEMTAAFVVTWRGRLIGERYGDGISLYAIQFEPDRVDRSRDVYTEYMQLKRRVPGSELYTNDLVPERK